MNVAQMHNIGALFTARAAGGGRLVAGGAGDNTAVVGSYVARPQMALSAKLVITARAVLAAAATLTVDDVLIETASSSGGAGNATFRAINNTASTLTLTGPGGGGTVLSVLEIDVDLGDALEYVRATYTPDLSAANTDTAEVTATWNFGGLMEVPV